MISAKCVQNLTFCPPCFSYYLAPAEPFNSLLRMEYGLRHLHGPLAHGWKIRGEWNQTILLEAGIVVGSSILGAPSARCFSGLHMLGVTESTPHRFSGNCGICFKVFSDSPVTQELGVTSASSDIS